MHWDAHIDILPSDPRLATDALDDLARDFADRPDATSLIREHERLISSLAGNSAFMRQLMRLEPPFFARLLTEGPDSAFNAALAEMTDAARTATEQTALMRSLRIGRRRVALLAAAADIAGHWDVRTVIRKLSDFADRAISLSVDFLLWTRMKRGDLAWPRGVEEAPFDGFAEGSGYVVLGLGKLGGRELNYSSDIDLIVLYDEQVVQYRGSKSASDCFVRMTQDLSTILSQRTGDGYVFRTDLRLRPDPAATPLAISMGGAEYYYQSIGKTWERSAMIKARVVGGDHAAGDGYLKRLSPWVWRKSLDFAAMQDIHAIKQQIHAYNRHGTVQVAGQDVKLGRGGIREIEFYAQIHQLIAGGRETTLRVRDTLSALAAITALGKLDEAERAALEAAYLFFRMVEHRLQMREDEQTQSMPDDAAGVAQIATFCGYPDPAAFEAAFLGHAARVRAIYDTLLPGGDDDAEFDRVPEALEMLTGYLEQRGFEDPVGAADILGRWRHGRYRALRTERARGLLEQVLPRMLDAFGATETPNVALGRFDTLVSQLPAGVQIFSLFLNHPALFGLIGRILIDAPALGELLARQVRLIDALLDRNFFQPVPDRETLQAHLKATLSAAGDYQDVLDAVRRWTHDMRFRVGCQILEGKLSSGEAGHSLSDIADAVLCALLPHVEADFARRHGRFPGGGLAIIGFGKYGGHELSYSSDLDLVLLYTAGDKVEESDGDRPLGPSQYFSRLATNVVTAVTALTGEGRLYEVDLRLRPSGESGPVVVTLKTFRDYQESAAWTWERMALTRARVISAPLDFGAAVEGEIKRALTRPQDTDVLLRDVDAMRKRMAETHQGPHAYAVKHVRGGLVDIEFLVQYLLLLVHDAQLLHPSIGAALDGLAAAGHLETSTAKALSDAYELYQKVQGILRLCLGDQGNPADFSAGLKKILTQACDARNFEALTADLEKAQAFVRSVYAQIIETPAAALPPPQGA